MSLTAANATLRIEGPEGLRPLRLSVSAGALDVVASSRDLVDLAGQGRNQLQLDPRHPVTPAASP